MPKSDANDDAPLTVIEDHEIENVAPQKQTITHKVKKGEVMQSIAKYYGVSVKQILAANALRNGKLKTGQVLSIDVSDAKETATPKKSAGKSQSVEKKQTYIVKRGDTLHSIADKFDVAVADLKRWNKKSSSHITPGAKLIIQ